MVAENDALVTELTLEFARAVEFIRAGDRTPEVIRLAVSSLRSFNNLRKGRQFRPLVLVDLEELRSNIKAQLETAGISIMMAYDGSLESPGGSNLENLKKSVDSLDFSVRTMNCFRDAGIKTVYDLVLQTPERLLEHKNFGRVVLREVEKKLADLGLRLGMTEAEVGPPPGKD